MLQLSDRLLSMEESATLAMSRKSRELKSQGLDIISLSLGEPDFHTPDFIKEAAVEAMNQNFTTYTPVAGYDELRQAIADKFKRDNGLHYDKEQIVVSTGAKQSIANLMMSLINPGDEVLIPAPYWVSYIEIVKVAGGVPVIVESSIETDFKVSGSAIQANITDKTKAIIFSSPCNPTGSVYSKEELKDIASAFKNHKDITIISDEIYEHINFKGNHESIAQFEEVFDQTVTINGMSKAWAMTGWRIGYIGAPRKIADACAKMQGQSTSGANAIAQQASIAALKKDPSFLKDMLAAFKKRRTLVLEALQAIEGVKVNEPEGAFYFFPDISSFFGKSFEGEKINDANDLSMFLLKESQVAVVTGEAFGDPNCIRISYATDEATLTEAMNRIRIALQKLK
ncbi:pyridoxal phosphate-dependent aminotransferase [Brumimicrobium aurantiacum]|uniref:Aminotransferase n=1 Tax=Brumimicrobium aurantiacum TaxID=1737063 RepID=A0A3E1EYB6_9FLAO|nr:pyridoxal phosphate-dependent aminotransferase [Brumimicrobium aurantiacum]RFC54555.1 pyridoxal phosphate-dependent aminotransferase [Brumimicrobium aurantiacum]